MIKNAVMPLLVGRIGGTKATRIRILRTCGIGESNIDQAIGDLMTMGNPTVGLAAHAGQTDVRITAKADTDPEADALIVPIEIKLRERLGISVYGVGKETVAEVVGALIVEQGLTIGVADTLTGGQLARELIGIGFGNLIERNSSSDDFTELLGGTGLFESPQEADKEAVAASVAARVCPPDGIGLAMLGPFDGNATCVALHGPGEMRLLRQGRIYQETDHARRWLTIQGLDWMRRALLGTLESPVD